MKTIPEWMTTCKQGVTYNPEFSSGHGLGQEISPTVLVLFEDGAERLRFGRIVVLHSNSHAPLPIVAELEPVVREIIDEDPDEALTLVELQDPVLAWRQFLAEQLKVIKETTTLYLTCVKSGVQVNQHHAKAVIRLAAGLISPTELENESLIPTLLDPFDFVGAMGEFRDTDNHGRSEVASKLMRLTRGTLIPGIIRWEDIEAADQILNRAALENKPVRAPGRFPQQCLQLVGDTFSLAMGEASKNLAR